MSVNIKKCATLSPELEKHLAAEIAAELPTPEPEALPLPPGFDASLFTPEQTEYVSDIFVATVRDYLEKLATLLNACEPGNAPTARRMGVNWAIFAKLTGISTRFAGLDWKIFPDLIGTERSVFSSQRRAMFAALRTFYSGKLTRSS